jgi:hypothetical protein
VTAIIIPFPSRHPFHVRIEREDGSGAWLVVCRDHGWLCGSRHEAAREAREIAAGHGVVVVENRARS